jgi:hypothetical protein
LFKFLNEPLAFKHIALKLSPKCNMSFVLLYYDFTIFIYLFPGWFLFKTGLENLLCFECTQMAL